MKKLLSLFLALTFILSFTMPAGVKAAGTPSPSGTVYFQIPKGDPRFILMPDGTTRTNIDDADVAVVKQGGMLIVWTMNPLTAAQQRAVYNAISSQKNLGIGGTSWSSTYFFNGMSYSKDHPYTGPDNLPANFGGYWASEIDGHYYLYASAVDKISHYILGKGIFQGATPEIMVSKQIENNPGGTLPTFRFTLKNGQDTVGTASIQGPGTVTFSLDGLTLPTGQHTVTLIMTEDQTAPANWTYSGMSYQVVVRSDGSVTYQNDDGVGISGLPIFTNTYTPPVTPPTPTLAAIGVYKAVSGSPAGTIPTFGFTLKNGSTTVGTASINHDGDFTFAIAPGAVTLPTGDSILTLTMAENQNAPANWTYSAASYQVNVYPDGSVSYGNSDGTPSGLPVFTNTYTPPVTPPVPTLAAIGGHKAISGSPAGTIPTFSFTLKNGQAAVGMASINHDGDFTFAIAPGAVTLPTGDDTLTLTMDEDQNAPANWTYSIASYRVVVYSDGSVVYENSDGSGITSDLPVFTNTYTQPVTPPTPTLAAIGGHKTISGSPAGTVPTFGFTLKNGQTTVGTASINHDGDFTFAIAPGAVILPAGDDTLTLTMTEDPAASANWTYSTASYRVIVHSDGSVTYQNSSGGAVSGLPVFTNTYTQPVTPPAPTLASINARKAISGNPIGTVPTFRFTLKNGQATVGTASINKEGEFTFTIPQGAVTLPTGNNTLALTMTEDPAATVEPGWTHSAASYRVIVHSDGSVTYQNSSGGAVSGLPVFTNTYSTTVIPPENPPLGPAPELSPIKVHKSVTGNPAGDLPTFRFTLKNGQATVGTASIDHAGTATFAMRDFTLPTGDNTVTLTMTEDQPQTLPAGWAYSSASYRLVVHSDGSVVYENSDGSRVNGIPEFINVYSTTNIPDPNVPQSPGTGSEDNVTIPDAVVPLADNPQTDDSSSPLAEIITAFISLGLGTLLVFRRRLNIHLRRH